MAITTAALVEQVHIVDHDAHQQTNYWKHSLCNFPIFCYNYANRAAFKTYVQELPLCQSSNLSQYIAVATIVRYQIQNSPTFFLFPGQDEYTKCRFDRLALSISTYALRKGQVAKAHALMNKTFYFRSEQAQVYQKMSFAYVARKNFTGALKAIKRVENIARSRSHTAQFFLHLQKECIQRTGISLAAKIPARLPQASPAQLKAYANLIRYFLSQGAVKKAEETRKAMPYGLERCWYWKNIIASKQEQVIPFAQPVVEKGTQSS